MRGMKNRSLFYLPALALAGGLFASSAARADDAAMAPVKALDDGLIATMKAASAGQDFQTRYTALAPIVENAYNFPVVTQNSVGFLWSTLPAAQQTELINLFTQFTIASYVSQFDNYNGQTITILPGEKPLGSKEIIATKLEPADVEIDYVVENTTAGWKIDDVLLNGTISQVAVHASDFSSLVKSGDASQLISALQAKIKKLQGG